MTLKAEVEQPLPYPLTVDPRNPLLPAYVSKAIRAIEEVIE